MRTDPPDYDSCCLTAFAIAVLSPQALRREKENFLFLLAARKRNNKLDKSVEKNSIGDKDKDKGNNSGLQIEGQIEQDQYKPVRRRRGGRNHKKN